jgi:hypothetical protein
MADEAFDRRYVPIEKFHALDTRVAVIENDIKNKLANIEKQNDQLLTRQPQSPSSSSLDQFSLVMQRIMDGMQRPAAQPSRMMWAVMGAAVLAIGLYVFKVPFR